MSLFSELHTYDLIVILLFLIVNLVVGFWQQGSNQDFREYAIGNKTFSTEVLTATIVATWMSGSIFFLDIESTYERGLYYVIPAAIGGVAGLLITGLLIGDRMGKFLNNISVPDVLGSYYGTTIQAIAGISVVCHTVGYIALQFKAIAKIIAVFFSYHSTEASIIVSTLVILYSASGGVKSVTFTDVVQFFTFGSLIPILALAIWSGMGATPQKVIAVLENDPNFSFRHVLQWTPEFRAALILLLYIMNPGLHVQLFQRMVMARNVRQIKYSFLWAAFFCLAIELNLMWVALLLRAENPDLTTAELVPFLIQNYTYPGLKGFAGVGILALAMSTADSALNSTAVVISNDILPRFMPRHKASLATAKLATLALGFASLLVALQLKDLLSSLLLFANFYTPIVTVPYLCYSPYLASKPRGRSY